MSVIGSSECRTVHLALARQVIWPTDGSRPFLQEMSAWLVWRAWCQGPDGLLASAVLHVQHDIGTGRQAGRNARRIYARRYAALAQKRNPQSVWTEGFGVKPLAMTYSRMA